MRQLTNADRLYFIWARKRRGLSQEAAGKAVGCRDRNTIANWENQRTKVPLKGIEQALVKLIEQWRGEDSAAGVQFVAREEREYYADTECPHCHEFVPGPSQAPRCLKCGQQFPLPLCGECRMNEVVAAVCCAGCGKKLQGARPV